METELIINKKKVKQIKVCPYCLNTIKKLIKCNDCKIKMCINCLAQISKNPNVFLCPNCLTKFVKEEVVFILTK